MKEPSVVDDFRRNFFWEAVREGERSRNCFRSIDAKLFLLTELKA